LQSKADLDDREETTQAYAAILEKMMPQAFAGQAPQADE
jgi:hypothetical protein